MGTFVLKVIYLMYKPISSLFISSEYERELYFELFESHVDKYRIWYKSLFYNTLWEFLIWTWVFDLSCTEAAFIVLVCTPVSVLIIKLIDKI